MENHHEGHHEGHAHESKKSEKQLTFRMSKKTATLLDVALVVAGVAYQYKGVFIAATVDGAPISRFAVIQELEKASGKAALDSLVVQKLIDAEIAKRKIVIAEDVISAEITKIKEQLATQGTTIEQVLTERGLTMESVTKQIRTQKSLEQFVSEKIAVTPDEIAQFIKDNKVTVPAGETEKYNGLITDQLRQQKMGVEVKTFVDGLRTAASIKTFVSY